MARVGGFPRLPDSLFITQPRAGADNRHDGLFKARNIRGERANGDVRQGHAQEHGRGAFVGDGLQIVVGEGFVFGEIGARTQPFGPD